jgi:hypothetical protein
MRGSVNGVQALFKNKVPRAFYIHYHNHRLNLVLLDVAKNVDEVIFFLIFYKIYIILYLELQFILSLLSFKNKF